MIFIVLINDIIINIFIFIIIVVIIITIVIQHLDYPATMKIIILYLFPFWPFHESRKSVLRKSYSKMQYQLSDTKKKKGNEEINKQASK